LKHSCALFLSAFISILSVSVAARAETAVDLTPPVKPDRNWYHSTNDAGFHAALPVVTRNRLIEMVRGYQAVLAYRQQDITQYLDENRMDASDALITIIMPGGLLYAAVRKANLEQAQAELSEITDAIAELSRDLGAIRAMQSASHELTVAQLQ
jgi:hypothetical protein